MTEHRFESHDFTVASSRYRAERRPTGLSSPCAASGERRIAGSLGSSALQELIYDWSAADSLQYYPGRRVTFRLGEPLWNTESAPI